MRAVLISAYAVLLVVISSDGPVHANENSANLADVEAAVKQNAETLKNMNAMLHLVAHQYISYSCTFNDLLYPDGSTVETVCRNQTCNKGKWISNVSYFYPANPLCCKLGDLYHHDGTTLEHSDGACKATCTSRKWIFDQSPICCDYKGTWYTYGTNISEESVNRTCEDGIWNIMLYSPELELVRLTGNENVESIRIKYNPAIQDYGSDRDWNGVRNWVDMLNEMIEPYEDMGYNSDVDFKTCSEGNEAHAGQVCKFDYVWLGFYCTKDNYWAYFSRSPCVIIKMSRITGWYPESYTNLDELPDDMPRDLRDHIEYKTEDNGGYVPRMVWVHCKSETNIEIEYTPWMGFPAYYFPYRETPGYLDPIVALRVVSAPSNVPINIECKAYAKNIDYRKRVIHFQLQIIE